MKPKGEKGNPFYILEYSWDNGVLRLDPYPLLDEYRNLGPRFKLKDIWPNIEGGTLSMERQIKLLHSPSGPGGHLEYTKTDIIKLAEELERESHFCRSFSDLYINAYLLHPDIGDSRLKIQDPKERKKRGLNGYYFVLPVQFFHVDVEIPHELRKSAEIMKILGV